MHLEPHPQFEASSISMHAADSTTCDMPPAIPAAIAYLEFHMTVYCYAMDSPARDRELKQGPLQAQQYSPVWKKWL